MCARGTGARGPCRRPLLDRHAGRRLLSARRRPRPRLRAVAPDRHLPDQADRGRGHQRRGDPARRGRPRVGLRRRGLHRLRRPSRRRLAGVRPPARHRRPAADAGAPRGRTRLAHPGSRRPARPPHRRRPARQRHRADRRADPAGVRHRRIGGPRRAAAVQRRRRSARQGHAGRDVRHGDVPGGVGHQGDAGGRAPDADRRPADRTAAARVSVPAPDRDSARHVSRRRRRRSGRSASTACWSAGAISTRRWSTISPGVCSKRCRRCRRRRARSASWISIRRRRRRFRCTTAPRGSIASGSCCGDAVDRADGSAGSPAGWPPASACRSRCSRGSATTPSASGSAARRCSSSGARTRPRICWSPRSRATCTRSRSRCCPRPTGTRSCSIRRPTSATWSRAPSRAIPTRSRSSRRAATRGRASVIFFTRSNRPPAWAPDDAASNRFPVTTSTVPAVAEAIVARIGADAAYGRRFSIFQLPIGGVPHQVIVRLLYRDQFREHARGGVRLHRRHAVGPPALLSRADRPGGADRRHRFRARALRRRRGGQRRGADDGLDPRGADQPSHVPDDVLRSAAGGARSAGRSALGSVGGAGQRRGRSDAGGGDSRRRSDADRRRLRGGRRWPSGWC